MRGAFSLNLPQRLNLRCTSFANYRLVSFAVSALRTKLAIHLAPTYPVLTVITSPHELIGNHWKQAWKTVIRSRAAAARFPCWRFQLVRRLSAPDQMTANDNILSSPDLSGVLQALMANIDLWWMVPERPSKQTEGKE